MIDTHCHLNLEEFADDFDDVLARALGEGIGGIVNIGYDRESVRATMALLDEYPFFYGVVGVHPHDAESMDEPLVEEIERCLEHPRVVAVGEVGLDYYRDYSPRPTQRAVFKRMLRVARERNKPVVIHCRDAFEDVLEILGEEGAPHRGIFHAFSGDEEAAGKVVDLGFHLGIGGVVTYGRSRVAEALGRLPLDRVVLETDSPYLTPHPWRGRRNEPSYVAQVARTVARVHGLDLEEVDRVTTENFLRVAGLPSGAAPSGVYSAGGSVYIHVTSAGPFDLDAVPSDAADEAVLCGAGEPLAHLDQVLAVADAARARGWRVRVNTEGRGNEIAGRNVAGDLARAVDEVVVVFRGTTPTQEDRFSQAKRGDKGFSAKLDFVRSCVRAGVETVCEFVAAPKFQAEPCRKLARDLGAQYDIRMYRS